MSKDRVRLVVMEELPRILSRDVPHQIKSAIANAVRETVECVPEDSIQLDFQSDLDLRVVSKELRFNAVYYQNDEERPDQTDDFAKVRLTSAEENRVELLVTVIAHYGVSAYAEIISDTMVPPRRGTIGREFLATQSMDVPVVLRGDLTMGLGQAEIAVGAISFTPGLAYLGQVEIEMD